ncbi:MAG: enoyl-CoA hydratase/isomerase family protein [Hydrogenophaga sp.]|uniref:enoyl-CoA hydratase/isomerase family protein n=1 Tax=Hydrogenophaga sp. TaxID=1904254 RepID=UPI003D09BF69
MTELIRSVLETDGVLLATIDMPDRTMNVFSFELMGALDALMDRVESDEAVRAVVLTSGKSSFLAGADLVMVRGYCSEARRESHEHMFERCGRLGRQFVRLEASEKPWIAAVNGLAMGGGLELAMACRARVVADDARIQLALPEIRWGLLPGAGGTQRLPRLVGFELGLDLLLTGRSLSPAEAVRAGLFAHAVPADRLLEQARTMARNLMGQAYDPRLKFAHLAQADVPVHGDETARALALHHGVSDDTFSRYPAYSAIVDSVLKGARLPLAEATAVEMNQFLRLMFSPVAGRMVRTLFLERLRAERELAPPRDTQLASIRHGAFSAGRQTWAQALARVKVPCTQDDALSADSLALTDSLGHTYSVRARVLGDAAQAGEGETVVVLAPAGAYGRVLEIVGRADEPAAALAAALAQRLWAVPWRSNGTTGLLQSLVGKDLPEQAALALRWAARPGAGDPAFLDVAACLSGVAPGWSGGPLAWLWDEQARVQPALDASASAAWEVLKPRLAQDFA